MNELVPEHIQKATTKCRCTHAANCDGCKNADFCQIKYTAGDNILFLDVNAKPDCNYSLSYGHGYICTCPTNYYLYAHHFR
jgi:hypothetical protein